MTIKPDLFLFSFTLCTYFILYTLLDLCVCVCVWSTHCFASKTECVEGWGGSGRPSLTPWSLISLLVRVMDDDGQASVCYVSLHTYSKKHSWCPTDSSTHIHTPSVIQLLTVSKAISQWVDAKSALCVCVMLKCVCLWKCGVEVKC